MRKPLWITFGVLLVFGLTRLFFQNAIGYVVPALLLFVPLWVLPPWRGPGGWAQILLATFFLDRSWSALGRSLKQFLLWALIVYPPFLICAHFWMLGVEGRSGFHAAPVQVFSGTLLYQILMVAFPEEFFFRGYLQTELNKVWAPRWRLFGVPLGLGWIATALVFSFAHSVIAFQWWHFSIFFPALLFGYLRERTGSITAPILFHAFSNSFMNWFVAGYY